MCVCGVGGDIYTCNQMCSCACVGVTVFESNRVGIKL